VKKLCLPEHFSGMNVRCPTPVESQATSSARLHRIGTDGLVNECSCKSVLVGRYKISVQAQEEIYI